MPDAARPKGAAPLRRVLALLIPAALFLLASCAEKAPQDTLEPAGDVARSVDQLQTPIFWIAIGVFFLVEGLLVVALIRFRHRPGRNIPRQTHGNRMLEMAWTMAPAVLLAGVAVPTLLTLFRIAREPAGEVVKVTVVAHQWWWDIRYPELGVVTANEMHIPVNRPVLVTLRAADVIHSFWVPKISVKQDVVPGQATTLQVEADAPGTYFGQCAEYCGLSHANMRLRVIAHPAAGFQAWVQGQRQPAQQPSGLAAEGQRLFQNGPCVGCHTVKGLEGAVGTLGPDLTHFASRRTFAAAMFQNTTENLTNWMRDPPAVKPGARMPDYHLAEGDIRALVAYLESLR